MRNCKNLTEKNSHTNPIMSHVCVMFMHYVHALCLRVMFARYVRMLRLHYVCALCLRVTFACYICITFARYVCALRLHYVCVTFALRLRVMFALCLCITFARYICVTFALHLCYVRVLRLHITPMRYFCRQLIYCKFCRNEYSTSQGSTSNLWKHMKTEHMDKIEAMEVAIDDKTVLVSLYIEFQHFF